MPFLSVVIPVFNEENKIEEAIRRIFAFLSLKKSPFEIIVSDDGSTDRTRDLVTRYAQAHPECPVRLLVSERNRGKGAAVKQGVLDAKGECVLVTDADLSAPIKESQRLLKAIEVDGFDVAIGSRAVHEELVDVQQSFKRKLGGRIFNFFVKSLILQGFRDTQCGFKCFKTSVARILFRQQTLDGFSFDVEILYLAKRAGYRIAEVPVMWREGKDSRVRLARDSARMVRELIKLRRRYGRIL